MIDVKVGAMEEKSNCAKECVEVEYRTLDASIYLRGKENEQTPVDKQQ